VAKTADSRGLLQGFPLAAARGLPKYAQLRDTLLAAIEAGRWKSGEKLPTEQELARTTPFSLGTVQKALRALVDDGVITRIQGSGSFVSSTHAKVEDVFHCRFLNDDESGYLPVFSEVVSRRVARGKGPWKRYFPGSGRQVSRIDRKLDVNGEFSVYARFYFDAERFNDLAARPAAQLSGANFKEVLRTEFDVPVTNISQRMTFEPFPAEVAQSIGARQGTVGGLMEIVGRSGSGELAYYQQIFIPPSRRKLVTQPA
jgi:DNA-binding GntR family transcriptional regulator